MFSRRVLFIVGAGASAEFNLPVGDQLKSKIADVLTLRVNTWREVTGSSKLFWNEIKRHVAKNSLGEQFLQECFRSCQVISDAMVQAPSIDYFIDAHEENKAVELCGKFAIAASILAAENSSKMKLHDVNDSPTVVMRMSDLADTWLMKLQSMIFTGRKSHQPEKIFDNISFITFNYDRCIEHFLYHAAIKYFSLEKNLAGEIVDAIPMVHVYGSLGRLEWQNGPSAHVPFGGLHVLPSQLNEIAGRLRTFTQSLEDSDLNNNIDELVDNAAIIVFLGCGYHPQNIDILRPQNGQQRGIKSIFGTKWGVSDSNSDRIVSMLSDSISVSRNGVTLYNGKCASILHEYERLIIGQ